MDKAKESVLKKSEEPEGVKIKGYDFSKPFDINKFLDAYGTTGFQASHVKAAIDIIKKMREEKVTIFFGYTSNMVSSGLREAIAYLAKKKYVDVIVTTAGGVEEDIIKCFKPFILGSFRLDGKMLREKGINRTGNILVPNDRYIEFEEFMKPFLKKLYDEQKKTEKIITSTEFIRRLGKEINSESSILYWAYKNGIPVICPAITDGSIGDMIFFFKHECPNFKIDITDDIVTMSNLALDAKETGAIILGGSLPKHHIMNANMMREGTKYTVYINSAIEGDGSDSGALPEEAVSWGKAAPNPCHVKIWGDATIIFPLVVAGAFMDEK
ncbi:MAG: deoxyhypusine synthase [Candidatus Aenigmarchaeota archaeon]|nr:deoxyhypusine synthase [Candidatus Aenigmarchaeota archaeon]